MCGQKLRLWWRIVRWSGYFSLLATLIMPLPLLAHGVKHRGTHRGKNVAWPTTYFAPYINDLSNASDLVALSRTSGTRFFTLAFIESSQGKDCQATWNTRKPADAWLQANLEALRKEGGDVRVAFGGSSNSELAATCPTVHDLQAQYQSVIATYKLSHIDFDIEGQTLHNAQATDRRNQAIAALQRQAIRAGKDLTVSYTLPVETTGFKESSLKLLRDAIQRGVGISVINLMVMDYYSQLAPGDQMAQNAIAAATSVVRQLQALYPGRAPAQLWGMLGLTPMIGVNDNTSEIFSLQDAQTLVLFAQQRHLPLLAFWSLSRDKTCGPDQTAPHSCSGIIQQPYDYAQTFATY